MADVEVKEFGKYIVADPRICHGQWTFRGTRVMVWLVLDQIAEEMPWDVIVREWRGTVPREAIAEAVQLARETMVESNDGWRSAALEQLSIAG